MSLFWLPIQRIYEYRALLLRTTFNELKSMYAGSVLGLFWVVLGPILLLTVYGLIYAVIFRVRPVEMTVVEYVMYVFSGLVPFIAFATAMTAGASSLSSNKQVLLNTVFPAELIPLRSVLVASASLPVGLVILFFADLFVSNLTWTFALVPFVALFQLLFLTGLGWVLSLMSLLIRDIQQFLIYMTMFLLVVTPIAYLPSMVPANLKILMYGNPLYYYVTSYQSLIILDQLPPLDVIIIGIAMSLLMFAAGYRMCNNAKQAFFDYA